MWIYLYNSVYPKPLELGTLNFETMLTTSLCVMCRISHVPCHVTCDTWQVKGDMWRMTRYTWLVTYDIFIYIFYYIKQYKLVELVGGGSVINGSTPSSLLYCKFLPINAVHASVTSYSSGPQPGSFLWLGQHSSNSCVITITQWLVWAACHANLSSMYC